MAGSLWVAFNNARERGLSERQAMIADHERSMAAKMARDAEVAHQEVAKLQEENAALRKTLENGSKGIQQTRYAELSPVDRQLLDQMKSDEDQLRSRFSALETTLVTTPEKAIAVPMLKQQLDTIQDHSHADIDSVRGEIGRLFTLTQWFIGLMFTIALGVFGLALSNLKKSAEKPPEKERAA